MGRSGRTGRSFAGAAMVLAVAILVIWLFARPGGTGTGRGEPDGPGMRSRAAPADTAATTSRSAGAVASAVAPQESAPRGNLDSRERADSRATGIAVVAGRVEVDGGAPREPILL